MVPLKSTVWSDESFSAGEPVKRTRQASAVSDVRRPVRSRVRRAKARAQARDQFWFVMTALALVVFATAAAVSSIRSTVANSLAMDSSPASVISVTVKPGDTLWTYARKYGAPGRYILDRVDAIARDNGLNAGEMLTPGETLRIRVENPAIVATLQREPRVASAN